MSRKGVIQNDYILQEVIRTGEGYAIACKNEKDAVSKRVSIYNAKRLLSEIDQRTISVQKVCKDGNWFIEITRNIAAVFKIIDGIYVPVKEQLKDDSLQMMHEMLEQGLSKDEIVEILTGRGELKETIEEALDGSN